MTEERSGGWTHRLQERGQGWNDKMVKSDTIKMETAERA